jgi:hypothetical protein
MVAEGGGDAGVTGQPQDSDGEVGAGHDAGPAGGAGLGAVLVEGQCCMYVNGDWARPGSPDTGLFSTQGHDPERVGWDEQALLIGRSRWSWWRQPRR